MLRTFATRNTRVFARTYTSGGYSGSINEAGGSLSKKEKAVEDQYFRRQEAEKLKHLQEELSKAKEQLESIQSKLESHVTQTKN
ncbi:ATPase inhibitor [Basidiobolus ranarum]|uniref:ATPase inhibitor, mitochondrial n=1 Tax=Basidiobolus ranarum TaxID=34480 RepID=A0ABR2VTR9_9FUNG